MRAESTEHAKLLREEAAAAKEAAAAARAEASRAIADAAFERSRSDRQAEHLEEQQRQAQAAAAHSSKCQVKFFPRISNLKMSRLSIQSPACFLLHAGLPVRFLPLHLLCSLLECMGLYVVESTTGVLAYGCSWL